MFSALRYLDVPDNLTTGHSCAYLTGGTVQKWVQVSENGYLYVMIIIFDANVHVGSQGVSKCNDVQDVGGRMLLSLVKDEGLTIINDLNL